MSGITFDYDGRALYGYSLLGSKIESMGENPYACVEVDRVVNAAEWCSVVARGTFERLHGADAARDIERIEARLSAVAVAAHAPATATRTFVERKGDGGIAYRITVTDKRGRQSTA